jgi:hypothetical protein
VSAAWWPVVLNEVLVAMVLHPSVTHHKSLMGGGEAPHRSQRKQEAEAGVGRLEKESIGSDGFTGASDAPHR